MKSVSEGEGTMVEEGEAAGENVGDRKVHIPVSSSVAASRKSVMNLPRAAISGPPNHSVQLF